MREAAGLPTSWVLFACWFVRAMSRPRLPSVRLVDLLPWQSAFCMFLLLSTVGWMLSNGALKPFPVLLPVVGPVWVSTTPFFLPPLNFFEQGA